jgi:hypothetical protein
MELEEAGMNKHADSSPIYEKLAKTNNAQLPSFQMVGTSNTAASIVLLP